MIGYVAVAGMGYLLPAACSGWALQAHEAGAALLLACILTSYTATIVRSPGGVLCGSWVTSPAHDHRALWPCKLREPWCECVCLCVSHHSGSDLTAGRSRCLTGIGNSSHSWCIPDWAAHTSPAV